MATQTGIVRSIDTNQILRVIQPDFDSQLTEANFCGPGEGLQTVPRANLRTKDDLAKFIEAHS